MDLFRRQTDGSQLFRTAAINGNDPIGIAVVLIFDGKLFFLQFFRNIIAVSMDVKLDSQPAGQLEPQQRFVQKFAEHNPDPMALQ